MMGLKNVLASTLLALSLAAPTLANAPASAETQELSTRQSTSNWWFANIKRQGTVPFGGDSNYTVFRNVMDYGAKGDGSTDDTAAINSAITDGNRCGQGCDSSTTTPAIVYFPPGTYMVSAPIVQYYYTQLVGDAETVPTIKALSGFTGIAVIDSDPYESGGANWYTNQNNFFRQVRNFKIDLTGLPSSTGSGIHWQVAQATSLQNIEFNMVQDSSSANKQQGIFMDNGSGGFMGNLTFNGGAFGAFLGNQQFTVRDLVFNNCNTAIYVNWGWVWSFSGLEINNCGIGIDMTAGGASSQAAGSVVVFDSVISNTPVGVASLYDPSQSSTNGTLVLDNVDMSNNVPAAISNPTSSTTILQGNQKIASFVQGNMYASANSGKAVQGTQNAATRPSALTDGSGNFVTKTKPQYVGTDASSFKSAKDAGAKGDGSTDDTQAVQSLFSSLGSGDIAYFDHGAYVITDTITVPSNVVIVGEIWAMIMAGGNGTFSDASNPKPVFQVGKAGDTGTVEIQDIIFETQGPQPGAILMEFNVAGSSPADAGIFDVHFRVGGTAGTNLQSNTCTKTPDQTTTANPACFGSFMMLHVTSSASIYMENSWLWTADHELDLSDHNQINIYNGRGMLMEATKGSWLWGTAAEHSSLVNYDLQAAQNVFMGLIQTETAYYEGNPDATAPFTPNPAYFDPTFSGCSGDNCARTWGLRLIDSSDIFVYGAGLYSFFDNYAQTCLDTESCQENMVDIESSTAYLYGLSTKASVNMVTVNNASAALDSDNRNTFCACIALFDASSS